MQLKNNKKIMGESEMTARPSLKIWKMIILKEKLNEY